MRVPRAALGLGILLILVGEASAVKGKWTPASDQPIRPFSKKYRDANPEPGDKKLTEPDVSMLTRAYEAVVARPLQCAMAVGACGGAYGVYRLRQELGQGWPATFSRREPWMAFLKPSQNYARRKLLSQLRFQHFSDPVVLSPLAGEVPGFRTFVRKSKVGENEADFLVAVRALRSWRMCESVRWLDLHLSREPHGSTVREDAALILSGVWGHVLAPMRVCSSDAQLVASPLRGQSGESGGAGADAAAASVGSERGDGSFAGEKRQPRKASVTMASLDGHFLDCRITFSVELKEGGGKDGGVWFTVESVSRKAKGAFSLFHPYLSRLHRQAMREMCDNMPASVEACKLLQAVRDQRCNKNSPPSSHAGTPLQSSSGESGAPAAGG